MKIGNRTNPLTIRLHEEFGMTWTEYAKDNNISYGQLTHVINGRSHTPYIIEKLKDDGLWWNTMQKEEKYVKEIIHRP